MSKTKPSAAQTAAADKTVATAKARVIPHAEVYAKWRDDPDYVEARAELAAVLADEFALVAAMIRARTTAGLTQAQVAERMASTQPAVARLEAGGRIPSTQTLQRYAKATGHRLRISFEPEPSKA
jgi:ribosome-binding protein aMBF1 (putative translation factor)